MTLLTTAIVATPDGKADGARINASPRPAARRWIFFNAETYLFMIREFK